MFVLFSTNRKIILSISLTFAWLIFSLHLFPAAQQHVLCLSHTEGSPTGAVRWNCTPQQTVGCRFKPSAQKESSMRNCVLWVVCFIVYFFLTSLLCCGYAFLKHVTIVVPTLGASYKLPSAGIPLHHHHHHQLSSHFFTKNTQERNGTKYKYCLSGFACCRVCVFVANRALKDRIVTGQHTTLDELHPPTSVPLNPPEPQVVHRGETEIVNSFFSY